MAAPMRFTPRSRWRRSIRRSRAAVAAENIGEDALRDKYGPGYCTDPLEVGQLQAKLSIMALDR